MRQPHSEEDDDEEDDPEIYPADPKRMRRTRRAAAAAANATFRVAVSSSNNNGTSRTNTGALSSGRNSPILCPEGKFTLSFVFPSEIRGDQHGSSHEAWHVSV